jgi:hypothetical protein
MAKKHWIYIKRGLSEDPKHRANMGECIWLYMHIVDSADWETGIMYDWKDAAIAADMSLNPRTVRDWRQRLDKTGYISCIQKQHSLEIIIHNWNNPRNYGGETLNKFQGDMSTSSEGDTQGDTQGGSQHVTPTYDSKSISTEENFPLKEKTQKKGDLVDGLIHFAEQAKSQGVDKVEACLCELERGLKRNIMRTPQWQDLAKWILKQPAPLSRWISWYMNDLFRQENAWRISPEQVRNSWPTACPPEQPQPVQKPKEPEPEYVHDLAARWEKYQKEKAE